MEAGAETRALSGRAMPARCSLASTGLPIAPPHTTRTAAAAATTAGGGWAERIGRDLATDLNCAMLDAVASLDHDRILRNQLGLIDATLREEIEKAGHLMFASSAKQRDFWLGQGKASPTELLERYGGLKPCIWGCDAHELAR